MALIRIVDSLLFHGILCGIFPFKLQLQRVANSLLPWGPRQEAQQLQPGCFHRAKVRSVVFAAKLGRCHLVVTEAVLELVQPF